MYGEVIVVFPEPAYYEPEAWIDPYAPAAHAGPAYDDLYAPAAHAEPYPVWVDVWIG